MVTMVSLPTGYLLRVGPPSVSAYLYLREATGMSPKTHQQALAGIDGAWAAVHVIHAPTGETVAMGRVIGDGGWYFHIIDMAVLPEHQRQGLGDTILTWLLDRIRQDAPPDAFVSLMADPPGRSLYERHGFKDRSPRNVGMSRLLERQLDDD